MIERKDGSLQPDIPRLPDPDYIKRPLPPDVGSQFGSFSPPPPTTIKLTEPTKGGPIYVRVAGIFCWYRETCGDGSFISGGGSSVWVKETPEEIAAMLGVKA